MRAVWFVGLLSNDVVGTAALFQASMALTELLSNFSQRAC
jgi:hypothetical protein